MQDVRKKNGRWGVRIMGKISCNQSYVSNELTHFVGRRKPTDDGRFLLLCEILRVGKLGKGPGSIGICTNHDLGSNDLLVPEMVCFCDIPLDSVSIHMGKYGRFGLAFTKAFMKTKGCNPVYYVSRESPCTDHRYGQNDPRREVRWGDFFQTAFNGWYPTIKDRDPSKLSPIENLLLWYIFGHVKFFDSTLDEDDLKNYYMEREWRIIGRMEFAMDDVARVILPSCYVSRFRARFSDFAEDRIHEV